MRELTDKLIITFPTTMAAIAMEGACTEDGAPGRLLPVPTKISAGCGMCWCAELADEEEVCEVLSRHGLVFEGIHHI